MRKQHPLIRKIDSKCLFRLTCLKYQGYPRFGQVLGLYFDHVSVRLRVCSEKTKKIKNEKTESIQKRKRERKNNLQEEKEKENLKQKRRKEEKQEQEQSRAWI
eukprot:TRINITY_DN35799_c2_g1_i1.p4 TRINITY_DN35799_c2_g1~~TRINITY_DN35799_c2_g1_i1.p4  ORF type:complete len:103 (+),score=7.64 TRINITY_DN35799_c2_g1_i1:101-409(+)